MGSVNVFTAARMQTIEDTTVVSGSIAGNNLILSTRAGSTINAGNVRGPQGEPGDKGDPGDSIVGPPGPYPNLKALSISYNNPVEGVISDFDVYGLNTPLPETSMVLIFNNTSYEPAAWGTVYYSTLTELSVFVRGIYSLDSAIISGSDWTITVAGFQGATGPQGPVGTTNFPAGTSLSGYYSSLPVGRWLWQDGATYLKSSYPELATALGPDFSVDANYFRVPNSAGRSEIGYDAADSDFNTVGNLRGTKTHTLTTAQIPNLTAASAGTHDHNGSTGQTTIVANAYATTGTNNGPARGGGSGTAGVTFSGSGHTHSIPSDGAHTHAVNTGGGGSHPIIHPVIVVRKIIAY